MKLTLVKKKDDLNDRFDIFNEHKLIASTDDVGTSAQIGKADVEQLLKNALKQFTEAQVIDFGKYIVSGGLHNSDLTFSEMLDSYKKTNGIIEQTEWQVEIELEPCKRDDRHYIGITYPKNGEFPAAVKPLLNADGYVKIISIK